MESDDLNGIMGIQFGPLISSGLDQPARQATGRAIAGPCTGLYGVSASDLHVGHGAAFGAEDHAMAVLGRGYAEAEPELVDAFEGGGLGFFHWYQYAPRASSNGRGARFCWLRRPLRGATRLSNEHWTGSSC